MMLQELHDEIRNLKAALERAERSREAELRAVVVFLKTCRCVWETPDLVLNDVADRIERGEHLTDFKRA